MKILKVKTVLIALIAVSGCTTLKPVEIKHPAIEFSKELDRLEALKTLETRYFIYFYRYPTNEGYSHGQYGAWSTKGAPSFKMVDNKVATSKKINADSVDVTGFIEVTRKDFVCLFREKLTDDCS